MYKFISASAMTAVLLVGCTGQQQSSITSLYDVMVPVDVSDFPEKSYTESLEIGPEGKRVPIKITWSAKADNTGCLRISQINVSRQGGDTSTVISAVKHSVIPDCGMKFESEDTTQYQTAIIQLHYESRKLLKTYSFNGGVASIHGNGEFSRM